VVIERQYRVVSRSISVSPGVVLLFQRSEQLFACASTATVVAAADEIGNLWYAGYGAGINLTQFISLSLSGLLILITTVRDSLFEIPRAAVGRARKKNHLARRCRRFSMIP